MPKRRLLWHLFPSYAALVAATTLVLGWAALRLQESSLMEAARQQLVWQIDFLDSQLGPDIPPERQDFARIVRQLDQATGTRITMLLADGAVDVDSRSRPEEFDSHSGRPELAAALDGEAADAVRFNTGLDQRVLYLAQPIMRHDEQFGVFYLSKPLGPVDRAASRLQAWLLGLTGLLLLFGLILAWRWSLGLAAPLAQLKSALERFAQGQWNARVTIPDAREPGELAETFNRTADIVQRQIAILTRHNNEQKAVLASMAEGVLAVDSQERVISMNRASGHLLGVDLSNVQGRRLQEVVRNADLSRLVSRALTNDQSVEADIELLGDRQRVMQAHGSALHDVDGRAIGAVIVLNDVTEFRKLELIRRDFVANVSHELKTPITSIKGFVETLLDGAKDDPVDAERFLRIVAKQADRLHAIIEDLLALSKIEETENSEDLALETVPLKPLLESAVSACQTAATDRQIDVSLDCPEQLEANVNPLLLEQAVVNLLDNAIKYSEPNKAVRVRAVSQPGELAISVSDQGPGIAEEHQSRIFERFYRVDRARSRKLGGTGLGLAIVKHIAQAHHGRVTVASTLGQGSTFTIHLPATNR
jgi:two-component system phosphate regulon sensor histidine kinase PhoR